MLVPILEADGTYSEIEVAKVEEYLEKYVPMKQDARFSNDSSLQGVNKKVYRIKTLKFKIDAKRISVVGVYVSEDYQTRYTVHDPTYRDRFIEQELKKNLAWLFTYGQRTEEEKWL